MSCLTSKLLLIAALNVEFWYRFGIGFRWFLTTNNTIIIPTPWQYPSIAHPCCTWLKPILAKTKDKMHPKSKGNSLETIQLGGAYCEIVSVKIQNIISPFPTFDIWLVNNLVSYPFVLLCLLYLSFGVGYDEFGLPPPTPWAECLRCPWLLA